MKDQLSEETVPLKVTGTGASLQLTLQPLQSLILRMDDK